MSGGSFNYLCWKSGEERLYASEDMQDIADAFREHGDEQIAQDTEAIVAFIKQMREQLDLKFDAMVEVWHAMEWWHSGDYGEDQVKQAVDVYRKQNEATIA